MLHKYTLITLLGVIPCLISAADSRSTTTKTPPPLESMGNPVSIAATYTDRQGNKIDTKSFVVLVPEDATVADLEQLIKQRLKFKIYLFDNETTRRQMLDKKIVDSPHSVIPHGKGMSMIQLTGRIPVL